MLSRRFAFWMAPLALAVALAAPAAAEVPARPDDPPPATPAEKAPDPAAPATTPAAPAEPAPAVESEPEPNIEGSGVERYRERAADLEERIREARARVEAYLAAHPEQRLPPGKDSGIDRYRVLEEGRQRRINEIQDKVRAHVIGHPGGGSGVDRYDPRARQDEINHYLSLRGQWEQHQVLEQELHGEKNRAEAAPFSVGIDWQLAGRPKALGGGVVTVSGLTFSYVALSFLTIGVGQIGPAGAELPAGLRWSVGGAPFVEGFLFPIDNLQLYLRAGSALQWRWGGREPSVLGVAPFASMGLRLWGGRHFSFGPAARVYYIASDGFLMSPRLMPRGTIALTGGLGLELHL